MRRAINKNIETKRSCYTDTDARLIGHNNFITLDSAVLATTCGATDPMTTSTANRLGDEVNLRGVSLKGMVELVPDRSDVTIRILVVKAAKGDTPTRATLFTGLSANKMLDTINTERYTVLGQKYLKLKAPAMGTVGGTLLPNTGVYSASDSNVRLTRTTKLWKMWLPGKKFTRGVLKYEDNSSQPKFFDYHVLMYAYCSQDTAQDVNNVAYSNDYIKQMFFKDA